MSSGSRSASLRAFPAPRFDKAVTTRATPTTRMARKTKRTRAIQPPMKPPIQPPQQFGMLRLPPARHPGPPHPLEPLVPPAEAILWEHRFIISCIDCIIPWIGAMGVGVGVATARVLGPCGALATVAP